ncbi:unnamed protein product [Polarella glacialis]|uniref:Apple domain-containing protein n=1 Tax=Polarella glacialis TaxID=89957 RepID=A0A813KK23_POLGL|nr:unnamed protein product [Polarella glacialis]
MVVVVCVVVVVIVFVVVVLVLAVVVVVIVCVLWGCCCCCCGCCFDTVSHECNYIVMAHPSKRTPMHLWLVVLVALPQLLAASSGTATPGIPESIGELRSYRSSSNNGGDDDNYDYHNNNDNDNNINNNNDNNNNKLDSLALIFPYDCQHWLRIVAGPSFMARLRQDKANWCCKNQGLLCSQTSRPTTPPSTTTTPTTTPPPTTTTRTTAITSTATTTPTTTTPTTTGKQVANEPPHTPSAVTTDVAVTTTSMAALTKPDLKAFPPLHTSTATNTDDAVTTTSMAALTEPDLKAFPLHTSKAANKTTALIAALPIANADNEINTNNFDDPDVEPSESCLQHGAAYEPLMRNNPFPLHFAQDAQACQATCRNTSGCAFFTWFAELHSCHLALPTAATERPGFVGGPASCSESVQGISPDSFKVSDLSRQECAYQPSFVQTNVKTPKTSQQCQVQCAELAGCARFTYNTLTQACVLQGAEASREPAFTYQASGGWKCEPVIAFGMTIDGLDYGLMGTENMSQDLRMLFKIALVQHAGNWQPYDRHTKLPLQPMLRESQVRVDFAHQVEGKTDVVFELHVTRADELYFLQSLRDPDQEHKLEELADILLLTFHPELTNVSFIMKKHVSLGMLVSKLNLTDVDEKVNHVELYERTSIMGTSRSAMLRQIDTLVVTASGFTLLVLILLAACVRRPGLQPHSWSCFGFGSRTSEEYLHRTVKLRVRTPLRAAIWTTPDSTGAYARCHEQELPLDPVLEPDMETSGTQR